MLFILLHNQPGSLPQTIATPATASGFVLDVQDPCVRTPHGKPEAGSPEERGIRMWYRLDRNQSRE